MWKMLQLNKPDDFVVATGKSKSVREFIEECFKAINIKVYWKGKGINEKGFNNNNGELLIKIDPSYIRPSDISELRGNSKKAQKILKWKPKTSFQELAKNMVLNDIELLKNEKNNY
jgi:GDPmannose 4,6-dehydratase